MNISLLEQELSKTVPGATITYPADDTIVVSVPEWEPGQATQVATGLVRACGGHVLTITPGPASWLIIASGVKP